MTPWEQLPVIALAAASLVALLLLVNRSRLDYRWKLLLSLLVTFEGLSIALLASKVPWYFGAVLALVAGAQLVWLLQTRPDALPATHTMASQFLDRVTGGGALTRWFPFIGVAIAVGDIATNSLLFNARLGSNDWVVLTAAAMWVAYSYIPASYARERDFAFVFLNSLVLILVVPVTTYNLATGSAGEDSATLGETRAVELLLTQPLVNLLNVLGYWAQADGGMLKYKVASGGIEQVSIAQGCSGIYSTAIFVAAFMGFIATEYQRFDRTVGLLLLLGIITAYLANLLRMAIIIIAGHHWGGEALAWAHANVGWLIFLLWIGIFWSLLFKYLVDLPPDLLAHAAPDGGGEVEGAADGVAATGDGATAEADDATSAADAASDEPVPSRADGEGGA